MIVPAGSVITSFVDFLITFALMAAMMLWFSFLPDWRIVTLPLFVALAFGRRPWRRPMALCPQRQIS